MKQDNHGDTNMNLQSVCEKMGFPPEVRTLLEESGWKTSLETFSGNPAFMTLEFQKQYYPKIKSTIDAMPAIQEVAERSARDREIQMLAWHLHRTLFLTGQSAVAHRLPLPEKEFGNNAGVFFLMIAISAIPLIEETTRKLGLPARYAEESATWLGGTVQIFAAAHNGLPGHDIRQAYWLKHTIDGVLFRIGRFEFWAKPLPPYVPAIYRNSEGEVIALCPDRWNLNREGFQVRENSPDAVFRTTLNHVNGKLTGTPISPLGHALPGKTVTLDDSEWKPAVSPWDTVLEIHIPGGGGMTPEKVRASLREAVELFREHFRKEIPLFVCASWILNPEWEKRLPGSNLAAFQREVHLFPLEIGNGTDGLFFLFGRDDGDPLTYPADNSARRAMLDVIRDGGTLKSGGMFLFAADLKEFGTQVYRTRSRVISSK